LVLSALYSVNLIETTLEVKGRSTLYSFQWHSFCHWWEGKKVLQDQGAQ